ncbi:MAG: adenosylcobinamide-GDP ribazoletransferase, partial [Haloarculaceae archaeon]
VGFAFIVLVVCLSGVNHADGVADLGDAMVVHDGKREVLKDTRVGVGAVLALALVVAGLALAGLALAGLPVAVAVALVVAAEVGAKTGMAALACLGTAAHEGLGSQFTARADRATLAGPLLVAAPVALLTPGTLAAAAALAGGPLVALALGRWADDHLGGVSGDVFGATNELGRVVGLHLGVVAWTLS